MLGLVAPTLIAAVLALALSPRERARPHGSVHWWPAAVGAFLCELVLFNPPVDSQPWAVQLGPAVWLLTRLILLAVIIRNLESRLLQPALLAAVGLGVNTLVIALNDGYMPQSAQAAVQVWGPETVNARHSDTRLQNTTEMHEQTRLPWLGDVIAEPQWLPRRNVVSVGDLLLSLGLAGWTFQVLRGSGREIVTKAI